MSGDHDGDHHPEPEPYAALRARALESLLVEKGLVTTDAVDEIVRTYEQDIGPLNGAGVVARAWVDRDYKRRLLENGTEAIAELGIGGAEGAEIVVLESTPDVHNIVVCTLCSCYPWPVLGLPPDLVQGPRLPVARRTRASRGAEGSSDWRSASRRRYGCGTAPRPYATWCCRSVPTAADGLPEEKLAELVTRDSMIGVGVARPASAIEHAAGSGRRTMSRPARPRDIRHDGRRGAAEEERRARLRGALGGPGLRLGRRHERERGVYDWADFRDRLVAGNRRRTSTTASRTGYYRALAQGPGAAVPGPRARHIGRAGGEDRGLRRGRARRRVRRHARFGAPHPRSGSRLTTEGSPKSKSELPCRDGGRDWAAGGAAGCWEEAF